MWSRNASFFLSLGYVVFGGWPRFPVLANLVSQPVFTLVVQNPAVASVAKPGLRLETDGFASMHRQVADLPSFSVAVAGTCKACLRTGSRDGKRRHDSPSALPSSSQALLSFSSCPHKDAAGRLWYGVVRTESNLAKAGALLAAMDLDPSSSVIPLPIFLANGVACWAAWQGVGDAVVTAVGATPFVQVVGGSVASMGFALSRCVCAGVGACVYVCITSFFLEM